MEDIEELYSKKIIFEIDSLFEDNEPYPELQEVEEKIKQHPQAISKKRELELYLEFINLNLKINLLVSSSGLCLTCKYLPRIDNLPNPKEETCKKGYEISANMLERLTLCKDYKANKESIDDMDKRHKSTQNGIKRLMEIKKQKQIELEQYQERQNQINLQRRLR